MPELLLLVSTLLLVLLNGFFVASEFALVKIREQQIEDVKTKHKILYCYAIDIIRKQDTYLAVCQIGITMASLAIGWLGEPSIAKLLTKLLGDVTQTMSLKPYIIAVAFLFISALHIVIGEQAPKFMALALAKKTLLICSIPLYYLEKILRPFVYVLNKLSDLCLRSIRINKENVEAENYSNREVVNIIRTHNPRGWTKDEVADISNAIVIGDAAIEEIMQPISELITITVNDEWSKIVDVISSNHFSRFPVWNAEKSRLIGILHVKDLLPCVIKNKPIKNIRHYLRPILKVGYDTHISEVLREFKEGKPHLAIVYSKSKDLIGFVSFNDIMEEFFGDIDDEFKLGKVDEVSLDDGIWLVKGNMSLGAFKRLIDVDIESIAKTVAGLFLEKFGHFPEEGEFVMFERFKLQVKKCTNTKILLLKVELNENEKNNDDEE